jgi:mersacidin/lichenicidin family type 2 lantibiotic
MPINTIIRAWKEPEYRETLTGEIPPHPAGLVELSDEELGLVSGGAGTVTSSGLFCSFSAECMPTICNFNTWICPHGYNAYEAVILLGGARALDADNKISPVEVAAIRHIVAEWNTDPRVTGEQLDGVNQIARDLRPYISDAEWAEIETGLQTLNQTQRLNPEQLAELNDFAASVTAK